MAQAIPYLAFNGDCADPLRFHERVLDLGAKLEISMTGTDSPMAAQIPKEHAHRLHARLRFDDGSYLYGGDTPAHMPYDGIKGVSITMSYASVSEAARVRHALRGRKGQHALPTDILGEMRRYAHRQIRDALERQWRGFRLSEVTVRLASFGST